MFVDSQPVFASEFSSRRSILITRSVREQSFLPSCLARACPQTSLRFNDPIN